MTFILATEDGKFYTGRAGDGWVSSQRKEAFDYLRMSNAEYKRDTFNRATCLHGLTFCVEVK